MLPDTLIFSSIILVTGAILFLLIYYVLTISELECDYINARLCCSKLNFWIIPKFGCQLGITILILLTGHWILFLVNLPLAIWLGYEIYKHKHIYYGSLGVYDPTEINNGQKIKIHLRNCMIQLGFYLLMFFIYLYCLISSLIKGDPIRRHEDDEIITEL